MIIFWNIENIMKYKLIYLLSLLSIFYAFSCDSNSTGSQTIVENDPIDSFESALPHGASLQGSELSDEDKLKLAKAVGKKALLISTDSLQKIIENDRSGWCLYNFWNLECESCLEINNSLNQLSKLPEIESNIKITYVNTISLHPELVNAYIREIGIINDVFTIPTVRSDNWTNKIDAFWDGKFPAMLLINNNDGTRLFYPQSFSKDELQAILETLTL